MRRDATLLLCPPVFGPATHSSFGHLTLDTGWADGLSALVKVFRSEDDKERRLHWSEAVAQHSDPPRERPPVDRVVVRVKRDGHHVAKPWGVYFGPFVDPITLERPVIEVVLEACKAGRSADEISAAMDRLLDERQLRRLLSWSLPVHFGTLAAGYYFRVDVDSQRKALFSATRDLQAFGADPLFLDLAGVPADLPPGQPDPPTLASPQFPEGIPIKALRNRGAIGGTADTLLESFRGRVSYGAVLPGGFASIPPAMNRYRWWLLQFADLASAALANLPPANPVDNGARCAAHFFAAGRLSAGFRLQQ